MDLAYAVADVVISRSGASSVSELCAAHKATIFVPSPNVTEDHQTHNAMALVNKDAALIVKDAEAEHKDNPVKAFNVYRDKFVEKHFPQLNKKKEKSAAAYYESLLSKVEE
jgi:UDP-N-acetylglucosamine--N-acetylmuramyl-(pentapeptide) pyrophosphoryl-undecaprenol N-acetylglucosamine transferase